MHFPIVPVNNVSGELTDVPTSTKLLVCRSELEGMRTVFILLVALLRAFCIDALDVVDVISARQLVGVLASDVQRITIRVIEHLDFSVLEAVGTSETFYSWHSRYGIASYAGANIIIWVRTFSCGSRAHKVVVSEDFSKI